MHIVSSQKAYQVLREQMNADVEEFWVISLSSNKSVIAVKCLFRGTVDACLVHPRDVFRFACLTNASSLIIAHNHPTQDLTPSEADLRMTKKLVAVSRMMQIPIIDHLITGSSSYKSFVDEKWSPF